MVVTRFVTGESPMPRIGPEWKENSFSGKADVKENDKSSFQMPPDASCEDKNISTLKMDSDN